MSNSIGQTPFPPSHIDWTPAIWDFVPQSIGTPLIESWKTESIQDIAFQGWSPVVQEMVLIVAAVALSGAVLLNAMTHIALATLKFFSLPVVIIWCREGAFTLIFDEAIEHLLYAFKDSLRATALLYAWAAPETALRAIGTHYLLPQLENVESSSSSTEEELQDTPATTSPMHTSGTISPMDMEPQERINTPTSLEKSGSKEEIRMMETPPAADPYDSLKVTTEEKAKIDYIIRTVGTDTTALVTKAGQIKKAGKEVERVHPFKFLEIVFSDAGLREALKKMHMYSAPVIRTKLKWNGFLKGNGDNIGFEEKLKRQADEDNLIKFIPGFAKTLNIAPATITPFIEQRQWEALVIHLLENIR